MDHNQAPPGDVSLGGERRLTHSSAAGAPGARSEQGDHVGFALRLAYQRASANLADAIAGWGITPVQFQTLLRLSQKGRIAQNELGRSIGMPPANIHRIVRALRGAGLVAITSSSEDKRVTLVELTAHGRQTLLELAPAANAANTLTLSAISRDEQPMIMASLQKLAGGHRATAPPDDLGLSDSQ